MAQKAEIQYVHHYYTAGTAAEKVAQKAASKEHKKKPLPLFEPPVLEPDQKINLVVDPLSLVTMVAAAVLVVMMVASLFQYSAAHQRQVALQEYVYILNDENIRLEQKYKAGLDLEEIRVQALALGMIPAEEATTISISGSIPVPEAEPTLGERLGLFMSGLFE